MKAVLTIVGGEGFAEIARLTHPAISSYARQIGADFISVNTESAKPHFEKFRISDFLRIYERILFIDTDVIITNECPDIFSIVPKDAFAAWFPNPMIEDRFLGEIMRVQSVLGDIGWRKNYFNSGVMIVSAEHRAIFQDPGSYEGEFYEQTLLNYRVQQARCKIFDIGLEWNHTCVLNSDQRFQSRFIHYAGPGHIHGLSRLDQIKADLEALRRAQMSD